MSDQLRQDSGLELLQEASRKYQDIMQSISNDSQVLSLLERKSGQKGFGGLAGDALRQTLQNAAVLLVSSVVTNSILRMLRPLYESEWHLLLTEPYLLEAIINLTSKLYYG